VISSRFIAIQLNHLKSHLKLHQYFSKYFSFKFQRVDKFICMIYDSIIFHMNNFHNFHNMNFHWFICELIIHCLQLEKWAKNIYLNFLAYFLLKIFFSQKITEQIFHLKISINFSKIATLSGCFFLSFINKVFMTRFSEIFHSLSLKLITNIFP
jgi:hypothetical protein